MARALRPIAERFAEKVSAPTAGGCILWTGRLWQGYGRIFVNGRNEQAHRVGYELARGPIPADLVLDHLCRNRACVNPDHLEPVTPGINTLRGVSPWACNARKTHCPVGHPYDEANTYRIRGMRQCRACNRAAVQRLYYRKSDERAGADAR